jgi:protein-S-isoprenylcysteine O-methyltransferase Ste14
MNFMGPRWVRAGEFSFRYRGYLLPVAVVLLFIPSPTLNSDPSIPAAVGLIISLLGQAIRIATVGLEYIIRGGRDHRVYAEDLVTTGLYSHVRNPMYVANFFLALGLGIASNSVVFLICGVLISVTMHRAIVAAEENFLRSKFGAEYVRYCARVPRWMPGLSGVFTTLKSMRFDWERVLSKEYASAFDWVSATALLILVNLARQGTADDEPFLSVVCVCAIVARIVLSQFARRHNKSTAIAESH